MAWVVLEKEMEKACAAWWLIWRASVGKFLSSNCRPRGCPSRHYNKTRSLLCEQQEGEKPYLSNFIIATCSESSSSLVSISKVMCSPKKVSFPCASSALIRALMDEACCSVSPERWSNSEMTSGSFSSCNHFGEERTFWKITVFCTRRADRQYA